MSHTKVRPVSQVMSQLEPELADWLLEDIPNNHWVRICYRFPDVSLVAPVLPAVPADPVPLSDVTYRIVSLQDENITASGKLDSRGQAYHEGFIPGPVAVYLSTDDTAAIDIEIDNLQKNILQSFDNLAVLLSSQKLPLGQNLQQNGFTPCQRYLEIVNALVNKKPIKIIQLLSDQDQLSEAHTISIFLLASDDTFVSMLAQFIENLWREIDDSVLVQGFVLDLLNGLLVEVLQGEDVFIVSDKLSLLGCCKPFFPPAVLLLDEIVVQLRELIPLFQKSKVSTTLQGRTNTEIVVQWREPPNPQRCDKHYSNVALMPVNGNGSVCGANDEVVLAHTDFELNGPISLRWTRHYRSSYIGGWCCVANEVVHVSKGWVNYCREDGVTISFELPPIGKYSTNVTCGLVLQRVFCSVFIIKGAGDTQRVFSGVYSTTLPKGVPVTGGSLEETIPLTQLKNQYSEAWSFYYQRVDQQPLKLVGVQSSWGHDVLIEWNASGHMTRVVNKNDGKVLAQYDWGSSVKGSSVRGSSVRGDNGLLRAVNDTKRHWQYTYLDNDESKISTMILPNGLKIQFPNSKTAGSKYVDVHNDELQRYHYGKNHLLTSYTDAEENVRQYRYNAEGLLTAFIDPAGGGFSLSYDEQSRVQEVTNALGESWGCEYNKQGAVETFVDPEGVAYRINCNAGRPVSMSVDIEPDNEDSTDVDSTEANSTGVNSTEKPKFIQRYWQWDDCANFIMDSANGCLNQATYDHYGKLMQLADRGQDVLSFDYNAHDQLQKISANGMMQLAVMYHGSGMMTQVVNAIGHCVDVQFDDYGRLLGWKETLGTKVKTQLQGQSQEQSLSIQYDTMGRVLRLDSYGENTRNLQFKYEKGTLPYACVDTSGREFQLQFNGQGLLSKCECEILTQKNKNQNNDKEQTITWQYDACGRQVYRSCSVYDVKTQYDVLGRAVEHLDGESVVQCAYQSRGQVAHYQSSLGKIEHTYNTLGYRESTTHSNGYVVTYQYGNSGVLASIEVNENVVLTYVRDSAGVELYRKAGAYECHGDSTVTDYVETCFDKTIEEVIEKIRLQRDEKGSPSFLAHMLFVLQLDMLDFPLLLQQQLKEFKGSDNPLRGIAKIPSSSQIEDGIVVHHPISGELLLVIYQNQVYFYENNNEREWRDWNGNEATLNGICVAKECLHIKPMGDVDITGVMKEANREPHHGMLWDFVTNGISSTVMNTISLSNIAR